MSAVIFLIGAGASCDAGMPSVADLTKELRDRLPDVCDMHGKRRAEFPLLFDALAEYEPAVCSNYERFFEWLRFLHQGQTEFGKAVKFRLDQRLVDAAGDLEWSIKQPIFDILRSRHGYAKYQPSYFAKLPDLLPARGRLRVFTTNYDLSVEDACRAERIDLTTGFSTRARRWRPSLFRNPKLGINLYKLHGSVSWFSDYDPDNIGDHRLVERYPPDWNALPELISGPGSKLQGDEPFVSLYAGFHQALRRAKVCVAIGCSFSDDHIREPIRQANHRGMAIIEVNPSPSGVDFHKHTPIQMRAKQAFESGKILRAAQTATSTAH